MSYSLNKAQLIGNLGADPEIRHTQAGDKVCNLSIATSESWTDKNSGQKKERTEWHRVTIFNVHIAEFAEKYLKKGNKVFLEGEIRTRKWNDDKGVDRYSTEIVVPNFGGELISLEKPARDPGAQSPDDYGHDKAAE